VGWNANSFLLLAYGISVAINENQNNEVACTCKRTTSCETNVIHLMNPSVHQTEAVSDSTRRRIHSTSAESDISTV
jgi:hypothetical protein